MALVKNKPSCTCYQIKNIFLLFNVLSALEVCWVFLVDAFPDDARLQLLFEEVPTKLSVKYKQTVCVVMKYPRGLNFLFIKYQLAYAICNFLPLINGNKFQVVFSVPSLHFQMCPCLSFACTEWGPCVRSELLTE